LPAKLRSIARLAPSTAVKTRTLTLDEYRDPRTGRMTMLLNGTYWRQPVTETPELDTVEIWSLVNLTEDTHPIHLHLVRFQILDRQTFDAEGVQDTGQTRTTGPRIPPGPGRDRLEGYGARRSRHHHPHHRALRWVRRPLRVALPPARARRERDDAAVRGRGPEQDLSAPGRAPISERDLRSRSLIDSPEFGQISVPIRERRFRGLGARAWLA
jgi:hypothetical protein